MGSLRLEARLLKLKATSPQTVRKYVDVQHWSAPGDFEPSLHDCDVPPLDPSLGFDALAPGAAPPRLPIVSALEVDLFQTIQRCVNVQ
jgi:hypothetical protein